MIDIKNILFTIMLALAAITATAAGANRSKLDWSDWRAMPVMDGGRRMPLDTFARETVGAVCGRENPRLDIDKETEKFSAAELLFAWLVEADKWNGVDFLRAGNETLRETILEVPPQDEFGKRLRYVSPRCIDKSVAFERYLNDLARAQQTASEDGTTFTLSGEQEAAAELNKAYGVYRMLSFDPRHPAITRTQFYSCLRDVIGTWRNDLAPGLQPWLEIKREDQLADAAMRINRAIQDLAGLSQKEDLSLSQAEEHTSALCKAAKELNSIFAKTRDRAFEATDDDKKMLSHAREMMNKLAARTKKLARQSDALRRSLFDNGRSLRIVPALDPWALRRDRDPGNQAQPWLNLQTVLYASPEILDGYPADKVEAVRRSFEKVKTVYLDRETVGRAEQFAQAMKKFTAAVRELGESIEPLRDKLPIEKKDDELLAATAYPPVGFTANEVLYNRLDPFLWSWAVTLAALVCFALGFGVLRKPMFLLGVVVMTVAQGFTLLGLYLRATITGMIPVTNMFETVLFVAATVALLGIWFGILPILWPGLGKAWRLTALPWRIKKDSQSSESDITWSPARVGMLAVRAVLVVGMIYVLAIGEFNPSGDGSVLWLLPKASSGGLSGLLGSLTLWAISLPVFLWMVWFFPRAIPAIVLSIVLVPWSLATEGIKEPLDESVRRRVFVISGGAVALIAYLVAYYAPGPVFNRGVGLEMAAVLRNNFWLAIHVLIITASYGAGALAWGLGNVSLALYAFGRYRDEEKPPRRLPPKACSVLAGYTYRAIQLAVLLLAAGTITGAIWADFAWGRYWGWDPKEVWALVTLLVYMVILHGRWAGWSGDFGMAMGAVLGATSIMMAWYGVNFILTGGLHSYGTGSGGQTPVLILVGCNWGFVLFSAVRYHVEKTVQRINPG
ncbi:MAG: cytochrome c biogenesis protein CcsA [Pirellulales bacterium]|nr:cytochrome c biogenesis protein CcsA [Pirellulales bacterium]